MIKLKQRNNKDFNEESIKQKLNSENLIQDAKNRNEAPKDQ